MMELVNAYENGNDVIILRRDANGKLVGSKTPAEWVTYHERAQIPEEMMRQLRGSKFVASMRDEGKWTRIGWINGDVRKEMIFGRRYPMPAASPFSERRVTVYEGDVTPIRRWITDSGATIQIPRRAFFDFEGDSRVPFQRKEEARILSWCVMNVDGIAKKGVLAADEDAAEIDLLYAFFAAIDEFDQCLAWSGDSYDFPVLRARVQAHVMRVNMDRWLWLDQLELFKRMNTAAESGEEKTSMKLNSVAGSLGIGEKDDFNAAKTWDAWAAGGAERERLVTYNVKDVALQVAIEAKTGSAKLLDAIAQVTRVFPDSNGIKPTYQMDGFMLRRGYESDIRFPTKRFREAGEKYEGAFVMEPKTNGIERDVHVCDFASLYPSIMITWNMSPETKVLASATEPLPPGVCRSPTRSAQHFRTDIPGILTDALNQVLALRVEWTAKKNAEPPGTPAWADADRRSTAYKVIANSFYGVVGSTSSRFFDRAIVESVTLNGQWLIKATIVEAEKRGMRAIYGDTDSLFVTGATRTGFADFVEWCNRELYPKIIAAQGCTTNRIKLAYEKQFRRVVFVSAKRYAGQYEHYKGKAATADSKPEVKGLEYKRGDATKLARKLQERAIEELIVKGDENPATYRAMLSERLRYILNENLPVEEVQITKSVTKALKDYKPKTKKDGTDSALPVHVRVAKVLHERGAEVEEGTRIAYVVTDGDGGNNAAISADDYVGEFDRYYFWEKLVYPPTQRLLEAAFPHVDWVTDFARVRPSKPRVSRKKVPIEQLGLGIKPRVDVLAVGVYEARGQALIEEIKRTATRFPGLRPLHFRLTTKAGSVVDIPTGIKVEASAAFADEVARVLWEETVLRKMGARACVK